MADLERGARRLVTEVWALVDQGVINARSLAADAALDLRDDIDPGWQPERRPVDTTIYPNERMEATAIVDGYLSGRGDPFDGWHHIDNARNDLLREIIKQLVARLWSETHAPDQPQAAAISYRSTGRGAYDVIEARAEGPDVVLAQVLFTEGVRGWRGAMERFTAHLATVSQDGTS